jgi:hypothetical protein
MISGLQEQSFHVTAVPYKYIVISTSLLNVHLHTYVCVKIFNYMSCCNAKALFFLQMSLISTPKFAFEVHRITCLLE